MTTKKKHSKKKHSEVIKFILLKIFLLLLFTEIIVDSTEAVRNNTERSFVHFAGWLELTEARPLPQPHRFLPFRLWGPSGTEAGCRPL